MSEVISPPVRILDFGYTSPNPIQYTQAGLAMAEPFERAVASATEQRNQFLLAQLTADRQLQIARWQHSAQLERERLRDQRMIDVAKMRAQSQLDALKEKGALDDIKSKNLYLQNKLGGDPIARVTGESDEAYSARLDQAIKNRMQGNIAADTKAAYSIKKQIDAYNNYLNDPRVNQAVSGEVQAAASNPGVQAQAQNYVNTNFNRWLESVAGDNAPIIEDALQKAPGQRDAILQRAGLGQSYNNFVGSATQQAAYGYLKAAGSPAAKQFATANENLKILGQQLQNVSMMPGDNGRMVPKTWWPQVQNGVDDLYLHDRQMEQLQKPGVAPVLPPAPATVPAKPSAAVNPVTVPGSFATGGVVGAAKPYVAPFVDAANGLAAVTNPFSPQAKQAAEGIAALPDVARAAVMGPWSTIPAPTADDIAAGIVARDARMRAAGIPARSYMIPSPVMAPATNAPVVTAPAAPVVPTNVISLPAMPTLQPVPTGAVMSPFIGTPRIPSTQAAPQDDPYGQVANYMAMRQLYSN